MSKNLIGLLFYSFDIPTTRVTSFEARSRMSKNLIGCSFTHLICQLVIAQQFEIGHYTILFKWITGFERIFHIHFNFYLFRNFPHRHLHGTIWRMALRRSPVLDQVFQNIFGFIFSVYRRGTCRPFHSRVSNVSNWYSPLMSTTLKLQTDVTSPIYPSFLNFFASMPPISPSAFFASTVDKIFQKNFNFSWRRTSSYLMNIHDYAN